MARRQTSVTSKIAHLVGPGQLKVINGQLAFKRPGESPLRLDPATLVECTCYGEVSVSGAALELLFQHGIQTAWFSPAGNRCRGRLEQSDSPKTKTRIKQHRVLSQVIHRTDWAKIVVDGKIDSMMMAARHFQRHGEASAGTVLAFLEETKGKLLPCHHVEQIRGMEGAASAEWFRFYGTLFESPWIFTTRTRRPPTDPINALLSLGYTWLLQRANCRAEAVGYEVYLGGLHEYRAGRQSLSCDLIEPLRTPTVDRWVVSVCRRNELKPEKFVFDAETGGFRLHPSVFGKTLYSWEQFWVESRADEILSRWLDLFTQFLRERDIPDEHTNDS